MRIIQLSDIHVWRYSFNPLDLLSKRAVGTFSLLAGRASRFRLDRLAAVVARARDLEPDHFLITGDLTTTALSAEFRQARDALAEILVDPARVTAIPGNHDRYTNSSVRHQKFEEYFGVYAPPGPYPWLRHLDPETAILGLDPTRSHISAKGLLPPDQFARARDLIARQLTPPRRLIVACHYPIAAPPSCSRELAAKRMRNAEEVGEWLGQLGPHIYCCGHVHAAWAFKPATIPGELCLNSGAPLLRDETGQRPPGFLEIELHAAAVSVLHHAWVGNANWEVKPLFQDPAFFPAPVASGRLA